MTRARTGFLGDFAAGFLAGLFFGVAFFAAGFRTADFLAAAFLAAGLAAGFRLAAAMADVSPVPSEGARALAVDSRVAAPQNDATAGSTCLRARPGNSAARKPPAAPGSPRLSGCADAAQQQSARRPGGALRSTRQEKATPCAPQRGISVGVPAHVITAIAPRSDGLSRATHVQIASRVTALRGLCVMVKCRVFRVAPLAATALRLLEQVQGIGRCVCAVYGNTVPGSAHST